MTIARGETDSSVDSGIAAAAPFIVGVGASAGGLDAVSALLREMEPDAPLALIVVQSLDVLHEGSLVGFLSRQTAMRVLGAADGALVEPGTVYVVPATTAFLISSSRLEQVPGETPHHPIDALFESLARDRGRNAAGVVLSGTGSDGSQGVVTLRRAGAATFAQDSSAHHSGMPQSAVATGCVDHVLPPADIAARLVVLAEGIADASPTRLDPIGGGPLVHRNVEVDGALVTPVDVDATQRGQMLLAEARDYAEAIVDTVRQPLLVLDESRTVRSVNRSFCRTFGVEPEGVEGRRFETLGDARWVLPELSTAIERLAGNGVAYAGSLSDLVIQFAGRSVSVSGRPLRRAKKVAWLLLAFDDLTEQMQKDAAVRRSERSLRNMLAGASEAIVITDHHGRITYANSKADKTFGYEPDELAGQPIEVLVPEEARGRHVSARESYQTKPVPRRMADAREVKARRKDGTLFPAEVSLSLMEKAEGAEVVAFVSDITERRAAEARLSAYRESVQQMAFEAAVSEERQRRQLAADLHDEVGQTLALAHLRLKAVVAAQQGSSPEELSACIELLGQALTDIHQLTFELSPPVLYDLGLPEALSWLGDQLEEKHHLHVTVEAEKPFVKLDDETAGLMFRALRELLTNVVKHAKTTEVRVALRCEPTRLTAVVEDHGAGFDAGRLKVHARGHGFGLFSVREQVARLGGTFEATSRVGQGTCISLTVPIHPHPFGLQEAP